MRPQKHSTISTIIKGFGLQGKISASKATKLAIDALPTDALLTHTTILSIRQEHLKQFSDILEKFLKSDAGKAHTHKIQNIRTFDNKSDFMHALEYAESLTGFEQCEAFEKMLFKFKINPAHLSMKIRSDIARRNFTFYTPYQTDLEATNANRNKLSMENPQYEFIKKNNKFYYCKKKS